MSIGALRQLRKGTRMTGSSNFAFLHGGGQGGWVWDETIAAMAAQSGGSVRCLALDAPGCGLKRGRDTSQIAFEDISRELIADIEATGMEDVVLVGHSQAGMQVPQMAEFAPGLFRKLIFLTCSMPIPGKSTLDQMGASRHGEKADEVGWPVGPDATMEQRFRAMFCNDMTDEQADAFLAKLGSDMWPPVCYSYSDWKTKHLADIPVTYILCERDMALPPPWQRTFAERLHAQQVETMDAGHQAMNTQPEELARLLMLQVGVWERIRGHGQALFLLRQHECRQIGDAVASRLQLPRAGYGDHALDRCARYPRRRQGDREQDRPSCQRPPLRCGDRLLGACNRGAPEAAACLRAGG